MTQVNQCPHQKCKGHEFIENPEGWEERMIPNPSLIFRRRRAIIRRCCGKGMLRLMWFKVRHCKVCNSAETWFKYRAFKCECCGHIENTFQEGSWD